MTQVLEQPAPKAAGKTAKLVLAKASQRDLLKALQAVAGIVERRHTLPILGNVLLVKDGPSLSFTTSDLEHQMDLPTELGTGESSTKTTVAARKMLDILKSLPEEGSVTLTLDGERLVITGGKSRFTLHTLPAADFPLVVEEKYDTTITMPQKALLRLIDQVAYSMAVRDIRFYLNGMLLETDGTSVRGVATDGHRMATAEVTIDAPADNRMVIIPSKAVLELQRLLKDNDDPMQIQLSGNQAAFTFAGQKFITKLVEGKFPDYRRVLPSAVEHTVTFERSMLLQSLLRAELMSSEKFRGVQLTFDKDTLEINVGSGDETGREQIGIDYEGGELTIGFNVSFLISALQNLTGDEVKLGLRDMNASVLITDPSNTAFRAVVMPMKV